MYNVRLNALVALLFIVIITFFLTNSKKSLKPTLLDLMTVPVVVDCVDNDPCTDDRIVDGKCEHKPRECGEGAMCHEGMCIPKCTTTKDCNDDDNRTTDICLEGKCIHRTIGCAPGYEINTIGDCVKSLPQCPPGTIFDTLCQQCVLPGACTDEGQGACIQKDAILEFKTCMMGRWEITQICGSVGNSICLDGVGCNFSDPK